MSDLKKDLNKNFNFQENNQLIPNQSIYYDNNK